MVRRFLKHKVKVNRSTPPNNVSVDDFNKQIGGGDIPTTDKTVEELLEDKYVLDKAEEKVYM
jgi:hypothetical protein